MLLSVTSAATAGRLARKLWLLLGVLCISCTSTGVSRISAGMWQGNAAARKYDAAVEEGAHDGQVNVWVLREKVMKLARVPAKLLELESKHR